MGKDRFEEIPYDLQFNVEHEEGRLREGILYFNRRFGQMTFCRMKMKISPERTVVMLTELPDNPGVALLNIIEELAAAIHNRLLKFKPPEEIIWIEHYHAIFSFSTGRRDTFRTVGFRHQKIDRTHVYSDPEWTDVSKDYVDSLFSGTAP